MVLGILGAFRSATPEQFDRATISLLLAAPRAKITAYVGAYWHQRTMLVPRFFVGRWSRTVSGATFSIVATRAQSLSVPHSLCSMGVLFDSLAAAVAGLLSVFLAFGNVVQDTHSLLESTSHICLQSCKASRGIDGERAVLGALTVCTLVSLLRWTCRRGPETDRPSRPDPALSDTPSPRSPGGRRRAVGVKSQTLAHLAVDASTLDQWLR